MIALKFLSTAASPSSTCILLLRVATGELLWPLLSACASCSVSSFVDGDTHTDLGPGRELCPCKGKPQVRWRRKQQHSHPSSAFLSDLLIRDTGRRGAQNNHVLRGMLVAKDTATIKSSSLYQKQANKNPRKTRGLGFQKALLPHFNQASTACKKS